jgi:hypothetical protein
MANLQQFSWYRDGTVNVSTFPRFRIEGYIEDVDQETGLYVRLFDYTGANRLTFPNAIASYTDEERERLMRVIAMEMVLIASGKERL